MKLRFVYVPRPRHAMNYKFQYWKYNLDNALNSSVDPTGLHWSFVPVDAGAAPLRVLRAYVEGKLKV